MVGRKVLRPKIAKKCKKPKSAKIHKIWKVWIFPRNPYQIHVTFRQKSRFLMPDQEIFAILGFGWFQNSFWAETLPDHQRAAENSKLCIRTRFWAVLSFLQGKGQICGFLVQIAILRKMIVFEGLPVGASSWGGCHSTRQLLRNPKRSTRLSLAVSLGSQSGLQKLRFGPFLTNFMLVCLKSTLRSARIDLEVVKIACSADFDPGKVWRKQFRQS